MAFVPTNWETVWNETVNAQILPPIPGIPTIPGLGGHGGVSKLPNLTQEELDAILAGCIQQAKTIGLDTKTGDGQKFIADCYKKRIDEEMNRRIQQQETPQLNPNAPLRQDDCSKIPFSLSNPLPAIECYVVNFFQFALVNVVLVVIGLTAVIYLITAVSANVTGKVVEKLDKETSGGVSKVIGAIVPGGGGGKAKGKSTKSKSSKSSEDND